MAIDTWTRFNYGTTVTNENTYLNWTEGGGELSAQIPAKSYTLGELVAQVADSMNQIGGLVYSVSVNRFTRTVTISATGPFDLLVNTGSQVGQGIFSLLGFEGPDRTGLSSYEGNKQCGKQYKVQFKLQSYSSPEENQSLVSAVINKTTNGQVEVVTFGVEKFYEFELKYITNLVMDNFVIRNNPTGLQDAIDFLADITKKRRFEIVPDEANPNVFDKVILESTQESPQGIAFKLKELVGDNLRDIYETGTLKLRVVT